MSETEPTEPDRDETPLLEPDEEFDRIYRERHPEFRRWTLREIAEERRRVR